MSTLFLSCHQVVLARLSGIFHIRRMINFIRSVLAKIRFVISIGIYLLSVLSPRRRDIWLFGSEAGGTTNFTGNSKYLYLFCHRETEITPVWISSDEKTLKHLSNKGYEAYHPKSARGMLLSVRAGVLIKTQRRFNGDIPEWLTRGAKTVQLWHGIPLKSFSFYHDTSSLRGRLRNFVENWDLFITTSDGLAAELLEVGGIQREQMLVTGYPRNEVLHRPVPCEEIGFENYEETMSLAQESKRTVMYMPTYRTYDSDPINDALDLNHLDGILEGTNTHFIIKAHANTEQHAESLNNVSFVSTSADPYPLLRESDMLVTDYSSVFFDYLLTDKQILFYPYDRGRFESEHGFQTDYDAITPGPKATDFEQLCEYLVSGVDSVENAQARSCIREDIHSFTDGQYSRRVFDQVRNQI